MYYKNLNFKILYIAIMRNSPTINDVFTGIPLHGYGGNMIWKR